MPNSVDGVSRGLAIAALAISAGGLAWRIVRDRHDDQLDRGKLNARCKVVYDEDAGPVYAEIVMVNEGRRPVVLTGVHLRYVSGGTMTRYFKDSHLRLEEKEIHRYKIRVGDWNVMHPETEEPPVDVQIEEITGRLLKVRDSKDSMKELFAGPPHFVHDTDEPGR